MRKLTKKQVEMVEKYVKTGAFENNGFSCDAILEELEKYNDYETLWSDADRLANDLYMKI